MNHDTDANLNRIRIRKFTWEYNDEISIDFSPGLNILGGKNQTTRTTVLRLIRYAMGGSPSRLEKEILDRSGNVILEAFAGYELIRLARSCQHTAARIEIFDKEGSKKLDYRDLAGNYLMKKLRLPQLIKERKELNVRLSLNDLARSFVIDRDISYPEILSEIPKEDRIQIMRVMLGISNVETGPLENREKSKKAQIERLKSEIEVLQKSLSSMHIPRMEIIEKLEQKDKSRREQLIEQEVDLKRKIRNEASRKKVSTYDKLRVDLLRKRETLRNMEAEMSALQYQKGRKFDLKKRLKAEQERINRYFSSESVLSSFTFSVCPRCLQEINLEMKKRETQGICMLCGRELEKKKPDTKAWQKSLKDIKQNLKEIEELILLYRKSEVELSSQMELLREDISRMESEIEEETREYVSESIEELGLISSERRKIAENLKELATWRGQWKYAQRLEYIALPEKREELKNLGEELKAIMRRRESEIDRINAFIFHFSEFMREVLPELFRRADWNTKEYLPLVNEQDYKSATSGFGISTTVIAFHFALLAMKFKEPRVDTNHPGLLIVDEPQQQRIPSKEYEKIMHLLRDFAESHKDSVQIIVAATDVPHDMRNFIQEFDI